MNFTMSIKGYYRRLLLIVEGKQATPEEDACRKDYLIHTSTGNFQPVSRLERYQLFDVLRGFALFGILLANLVIISGETVALTPELAANLLTATIDPITKVFIRFFIYSKFIAIFSFLFGLGFAIQLTRATETGSIFTIIYLRRLGWLLLFGAIHMLFFLWWGDILHYYALVGFTLLIFRNKEDRTVLFWGIVLAVLSYATYSSLPAIRSLIRSEATLTTVVETAAKSTDMDSQIAIFTTGSYFDVLKQNWLIFYDRHSTGKVITSFLFLSGYFLLGYFMGRRLFFQQAPHYLKMFRKLVKWGLIIGLPCSIITVFIYDLKLVGRTSLWFLLSQPAIWIGILAMSCFYIAMITLLFQLPAWQRTLLLLAPVGRMSLTNYLMQSLFFMHIFYGFGIGLGLLGRIGPSLCIPISIGIFALQIIFSKWWLKYFQFGPAEWLWRSLYYWKWLPIRV